MQYEIKATALYKKWFAGLKDIQARARIATRLNFIRDGHFGDHKDLPGGVSELRFTFGSGYRIYYTLQGRRVILLLVGGDKPSQVRDMQPARAMLANLRENSHG